MVTNWLSPWFETKGNSRAHPTRKGPLVRFDPTDPESEEYYPFYEIRDKLIKEGKLEVPDGGPLADIAPKAFDFADFIDGEDGIDTDGDGEIDGIDTDGDGVIDKKAPE